MTTVRVSITLQQQLLRQVDSLVAQRVFPNRSQAIQTANPPPLSFAASAAA